MTNEELIESLKAKKNLKECEEAIKALAGTRPDLTEIEESFKDFNLYQFCKLYNNLDARAAMMFRVNPNSVFVKKLVEMLMLNKRVVSYNDAIQNNIFPFLKGPLSQWHKESFVVDGITYKTAEHYMMTQKAIFFEDQESYHLIMKSDSPKEVQAIGRLVANFDEAAWSDVKKLIVCTGNIAKFTQCKVPYEALMQTKRKLLAEANPNDLVWGTGLAEDDLDILDCEKWKGTNYLGKTLTSIREDLEDGTLHFIG